MKIKNQAPWTPIMAHGGSNKIMSKLTKEKSGVKGIIDLKKATD